MAWYLATECDVQLLGLIPHPIPVLKTHPLLSIASVSISVPRYSVAMIHQIQAAGDQFRLNSGLQKG